MDKSSIDFDIEFDSNVKNPTVSQIEHHIGYQKCLCIIILLFALFIIPLIWVWV